MSIQQKISILLAEDDDDDYLLTKEAFKEAKLINELYRVKDGEELMKFLLHQGQHVHSPRPMIILLDLNMPRKSGREALKEIKSNESLKNIPVIILTTSKADEDILLSYQLGCNSFIRKPVSFERFVEMVKTFQHYWLEIVELPPSRN